MPPPAPQGQDRSGQQGVPAGQQNGGGFTPAPAPTTTGFGGFGVGDGGTPAPQGPIPADTTRGPTKTAEKLVDEKIDLLETQVVDYRKTIRTLNRALARGLAKRDVDQAEIDRLTQEVKDVTAKLDLATAALAAVNGATPVLPGYVVRQLARMDKLSAAIMQDDIEAHISLDMANAAWP